MRSEKTDASLTSARADGVNASNMIATSEKRCRFMNGSGLETGCPVGHNGKNADADPYDMRSQRSEFSKANGRTCYTRRTDIPVRPGRRTDRNVRPTAGKFSIAARQRGGIVMPTCLGPRLSRREMPQVG